MSVYTVIKICAQLIQQSRCPKALLLASLLSCIAFSNHRASAAVIYDPLVPQLEFAAQEIEQALQQLGPDSSASADLEVTLVIGPQHLGPESYQLRWMNDRRLWIAGSDATGAMYGGLHLADLLRKGLPVEDHQKSPFVEQRGIKFNIPWDARTPSYDDTGDAAQKNIATVWDFEFWREYLDDLARYRYNVLSLWSTHPYPSLLRVPEYPDVALDDVYRIGVPIQPHYKNKLQDLDQNGDGYLTVEHDSAVLKLVKKMTIEEKTAHWQRVFTHAQERGIAIYLFHWNVFTFGATGTYGITQDQTNPTTLDYTRASVRQALLTFPQIAGIGVTAGENADRVRDDEHATEKFIFNSFGRAIMDVQELQPKRDIRFIFRNHVTDMESIQAAFAEYPNPVDTSVKYAVAHIYSMRRPQIYEQRVRADAEAFDMQVWLNLRNDDIFVHRWGNPDFVRDYILRMPHSQSPGFYMGSDGYVWGREFISKNPETAGQLEIRKHWYRFQQWGQLAYDPGLNVEYWQAALSERFPQVDSDMLYRAWAATSEIIPQVNRSVYAPTDASFSPESSSERKGFLTVDNYHFSRQPMAGSGGHSVREWAQAVLDNAQLPGTTPLQAADNLDRFADLALHDLPSMQQQIRAYRAPSTHHASSSTNVELTETLNDIASMAHLGRYYANRLRGAAYLAVFRADRSRTDDHAQALSYFEASLDDWKRYADVCSAQYHTQLFARTHFMDWHMISGWIAEEIETLRHEVDIPQVDFIDLNPQHVFPAGSDLTFSATAHDDDGIARVSLYLDGLALTQEANDNDQTHQWSAASDDLLTSVSPGTYELRLEAEDMHGIRQSVTRIITVGEPGQSSGPSLPIEERIHHVLIGDGATLYDDSEITVPRLQLSLHFRAGGMLLLHHQLDGLMWKSWSKDADEVPHFAVIEDARLKVYRGTPDNPSFIVWQTHNPIADGPYQLGITNRKQLMIYADNENGERDVRWRSALPLP